MVMRIKDSIKLYTWSYRGPLEMLYAFTLLAQDLDDAQGIREPSDLEIHSRDTNATARFTRSPPLEASHPENTPKMRLAAAATSYERRVRLGHPRLTLLRPY